MDMCEYLVDFFAIHIRQVEAKIGLKKAKCGTIMAKALPQHGPNNATFHGNFLLSPYENLKHYKKIKAKI